MNNYVNNFSDFMVNEGRVVVKRKYTDNHPESAVSDKAPVRERILSFIKEKKNVSHTQLMEFINSLNEETGGNTSRKWVTKNSRYFNVVEKHNTKYYTLSKMGERVHEAIMKQKSA